MFYTESVEDYLEAILVIQQRKGSVLGVDIAEELGFSKASVSVALRNLRAKGLLEEGSEVVLTPKGRALAEQVREKHSTLYQMLLAIGVDEHTADKDACRMEHSISDVSFSALEAFFAQAKPLDA